MSRFPDVRLRRLRRTPFLRSLFDSPAPPPQKLMWPVFVCPGHGVKEPIESMPGQARLSSDVLLQDLEPVVRSGVRSILIFGLPSSDDKTPEGTAAADANGVVQTAVQRVHAAYPELVIATDVCLCAYTDHGHCGPLDADGRVCNDAANALLARTAVSHAAAGADMVAPSAMMDGQVAAIREALAGARLDNTILMSYSTKFASAMYGPFRDAEQSAPQQGDRKGYQASYADLRTALRESRIDEAEGADILMVKPSLFYLDVLARLRDETRLPIAAYNVSGEYAMLMAAADHGWCDLQSAVRESLQAIDRAGADIIITYWANQYAWIYGE